MSPEFRNYVEKIHPKGIEVVGNFNVREEIYTLHHRKSRVSIDHKTDQGGHDGPLYQRLAKIKSPFHARYYFMEQSNQHYLLYLMNMFLPPRRLPL